MTGTFPHLDRAPITEAILDVSVELPAGFSIETLVASFREIVGGRFTDERSIKKQAGQIEVGKAGMSTTTGEPQLHGIIRWTPDNKRAVQARADGFSVNHLAPYETWEALQADAAEFWKAYVTAANPVSVTRCMAKFINRVEIPTGIPLERILLSYPQIGPDLPQNMADYSMRVALSCEPDEPDIHAIIMQASLPSPENEQRRDLILDIEAVFEATIIPPDEARMWAAFDKLHALKNRCFFGSLHPDTWRKYQ